jgi:hypothetical protein
VECERTQRILAALDEFDQPLDLRLVERRIMYEFCELKVFSGMKRTPWFIVLCSGGFQVIAQGRLEFLRADDASTPLAVRVVLDYDITSLRNLRA